MSDPMVGYFFGAAGVGLIAITYLSRPWLARRHACRLTSRLERGVDATLDELRGLETYTPDKIHKMLLSMGSVLIFASVSQIMPIVLDSAHSYIQTLRI